ncbi:MAG: hypothetical protein SPL55_08120 [Prevotella sp.]|nr:hypothetical protein [Prevotella sp.]
MKQKLLNMLVALAAMVGSASAQTLSIAPIEAQTGTKAEIVVNASGVAGMTALQFNLQLPEGITLDEAAIAKGSSANSHELSVSTLSSGDRLFVLYNMNLNPFKDGELLRLPITVNGDVGTKTGRIRLFRTATPEAVSHARPNAEFTITVKETSGIDSLSPNPAPKGKGNWYSVDGKKLNGEPTKKGLYIHKGKKVKR